MNEPCAITKISVLAVANEWTFEQAYDYELYDENKRALEVGGYRYATLVSPDGAVKIALSNTYIYVRQDRGYVNLGDSTVSNPDYVTIAAVTTELAHRKQGKATAAMKQVLQWAQQSRVTKIRLEPCRIKSLIGSKRQSDAPNETRLAKWYKSLGFRQLHEGRNIILTTEPLNQ
ncbi:unnamed protein product [Sphagnum jensenii]|uniref:N-acetyltransferase domain-containing protein n=1 Tax=Sphagnum jensenii TaxID=128206 RepID=A0ABP0VBB4_9BRYO